jgi:arabinogalactan oligomer/maltooligosaccharide transport system substrate-binding protein
MHRTYKVASLLAAAAMIGGTVPALAQDAPVAFTVWTKEGEADGSLQFVNKLATDYMAAHPNVTITVVNKNVEDLRTQFLTTSLAHNAPELLWTVSDHTGPFSTAGAIQPVDSLVDLSAFLPQALQSVQLDGQTWGVPVSFGNNLMLYTNKTIIPDCPADTAAWITAAKAATSGGNYGIAYPQNESFWLVPFVGAFGGKFFADDGVTATLDTPQMVSALGFLKDLKWNQGVMPPEVQYATMDGMFKNGAPGATPPDANASLAPSATPPPTGVAASVINGDWTVGAYVDLYGDQLNICPIPQVTGADFPKPFVAGTYLMLSSDLAQDAAKQTAVLDFVNYVTAKDQQLEMVSTLSRLPGSNAAFNDPVVTGDPVLAKVAEAAAKGTGTPGNLEMRCVFDAMTTGIKTIYTDQNADPQAVATQMQTDYNNDRGCK